MRRMIALLALLGIAATAFAGGNDEVGSADGYGRGQAYADQGFGRGPGQGSGQGAGRGTALNRNAGAGQGMAGEEIALLLKDIPASEVSEAEADGLLFMYEEEKLARDVYTALYETWNLPIFQSIARSENQHMQAVAALMDRHDMDYEAALEPGEFADVEFASLYGQLVDRGSTSLVAALHVGATIEDLDIADLQQNLDESDSDDIRITYQNLMKGSRNHLRSFVNQLERLDETYEAQYISQDYLAEILQISREVAPITDPNYDL